MRRGHHGELIVELQIGKHLTLSYERKRITLTECDLTRSLPGKYVDTFAFPDGRFQVRYNGQSLPYAIFDKDQRVTQADIVENKRLSEVLVHIKKRQETPAPPPKIQTNSAKIGYKPRAKSPRRKGRRTDLEMLRDRQRELSHTG